MVWAMDQMIDEVQIFLGPLFEAGWGHFHVISLVPGILPLLCYNVGGIF